MNLNIEANTVLYHGSTLNDEHLSVEDPLDKLINTGFVTLVLGSLHVNPNGDLLWNDEELIVHENDTVIFDPNRRFTKLGKKLDESILANAITNVFWGLGSGGYRDFSNIANLLKTKEGEQKLRMGFELLNNSLPQVNGYDLNNEDHHEIDTMVWLTEFLAISLNAKITYRPYFGQYFWEGCLEAVYSRLQKQPVLWWNLQCYDEGRVNVPEDWAQSIALRQEYNGVENPNTYIIPGYSVEDTEEVSPAAIQQLFASFKDRVGGGFITQISRSTLNDPRDAGAPLMEYSQAIKDGLLAVTEDVSSHDYD